MQQLRFIDKPMIFFFFSKNRLYTVHTTCLAAFPPKDSCQNFKSWKPYAVAYSLALLKMGTMVPETCWFIGLSINHNCCIKLVQQIISNWDRYLHPVTSVLPYHHQSSNIPHKYVYFVQRLFISYLSGSSEKNVSTLPTVKRYSSPITGPEVPRGFQEVKIPRFRDNGTG